MPSTPGAQTERLPELDGLRGIAALSVFVGHACAFVPGGVHLPILLGWAGNGAAAVDLFFVLSGFVLALPYVGIRQQPVGYVDFWVRRIFRIYPAYWVAIALAAALALGRVRHLPFQPRTSGDSTSRWRTSFMRTSALPT